MSRDEKDDEMIYGLTADERGALTRGLAELPDTMPPRAVWHRVREQAEAEGLMHKPRSKRPSTWYVPGGIAAMFLLAALIVPRLTPVEDTPFPVVPSTAPTNTVPMSALSALQVESRQLERDLRSMDRPNVVRAGTQATILELEDRIAAIDYQLSDPQSQLTPEDEEVFWRERVRLMKLLVGLRYAQTQRAAY
ncbi:MAG: hypothetical protein AAFX10_07690 [Pseudomonadota bacterium]